MYGVGKSRLRRAYSDIGKSGLTHGKPKTSDDNVGGAVKPGKTEKRNQYELELVGNWVLT